jgi:hypothetical protein
MKSEEKSGVKGAVLACKNLAVKGLIGKHSFLIMALKLNMKLEVTCLSEVGNLKESRIVTSYCAFHCSAYFLIV